MARQNMVKNQILPNNVNNKDLIESFSTVQKEIFVPNDSHDLTYTDSEIRISENRNLMKTFIIAKMFDRCNFGQDDKVLVVGCLTGYSIAILSKMVNYVVGIDNDKKIVDIASKNIDKLNILNCSIFFKKLYFYSQTNKVKANVTISFRRENPTHHHVNSVTAMSIAL